MLALADILLTKSVSSRGSLRARDPRQEMQREIQESLSSTQESNAGYTAGRTGGGEMGKGEEREKETKEKDTRKKKTKDKYKPHIWNRGYEPQAKLSATYGYRMEGRTPQIGNQGPLGTC